MWDLHPQNTLLLRKSIYTPLNQSERSAGNPISYERLEFVGDAILSAVIAHYLFDKAPNADEGYLTKMRSKVVSREHLNEIGKELDFSKLMHTKLPVAKFGDNIHGNLIEALIGAVYLDKGYMCVRNLFINASYTPCRY